MPRVWGQEDTRDIRRLIRRKKRNLKRNINRKREQSLSRVRNLQKGGGIGNLTRENV
jgi:hypothetical protein